MQAMINKYNKYYQVTGGKISRKKSTCFYWKWEYYNGKVNIKQIDIELIINNQTIKQINIDQVVWILGVYIIPSLY